MRLSFHAQLEVLNSEAVKETGIAGCSSGTGDSVTSKGEVSHLSDLQGNSASKSFGKGKSLREKSVRSWDVLPLGHLEKKMEMIHLHW